MSDSSPRASRAAYAALLAVTVVWGATFLVMKEGIAAITRVAGDGRGDGTGFGPAFYLALRFALAFPAGCIVFRISPFALTRADWRRGGYLAAAMVAGFAFQIYGLERTTAATNAFLTSLYVVFTPLLDRIFGGRPAAGRVLAGVALALAGVVVLFRPWTGAPGSGEVLSAACAVLFAVHIVLIDRLTRDGRAVELTLTTIGWAAAFFLIVVPFLGGSGHLLKVGLWSAAFSDPWLWAGLPGIVLLATVGALWVSNRYQKEVSPSRAAVIYTIEPVWALLFSGLAGKESLDLWFCAGAVLIVAGNIWSEGGVTKLVAIMGGRSSALARREDASEGGEAGSGGEALPPGRQEAAGEAEGAKPPRGGAKARDGRSADGGLAQLRRVRSNEASGNEGRPE